MSSVVVPPVGARIRRARTARGVSLRGLAREIGVSASLISQIETGKSQPSVSTLYAITTALSIPVESLFGAETADDAEAGTGAGGEAVRGAGTGAEAAGEVLAGARVGRAAGAADSRAGADARGDADTGTSPDGDAPVRAGARSEVRTVSGARAVAGAHGTAGPRGGADGDGEARTGGDAGADADGGTGGTDAGQDARDVAVVGPARARVPAPLADAPAAGAVGQGHEARAGTPPDTVLRAVAGFAADPRRRIGPLVGGAEREVLELDSGVVWERLGRVPGADVDFLLVTYHPGGASSGTGGLMRHPGTEYGYLTSGELLLTLGFDEYVIRPGDAVCFDSTTPHRYRNEGAEPAVGVWFVFSMP